MLQLAVLNEEQGMAFSLEFEHCLRSISKWEQKYKKPFYDGAKTPEETIDYIRDMLLTPDPPSNWMDLLTEKDATTIIEYIHSNQTATTFGMEVEQRGPKEVLTAELVYYWLVQFRIPFEVQDWHITRTMALIKIASIKQSKPKKMDKKQVAEQYRKLNEQRRQEMGTAG